MEKINSLPTPCFVLDEAELERSVRGFQQALDRHFDKAIVGYSVKTNSLPYCMKRAGEMGAYAEVVSHDEYELARLCGFAPNRIIYNGPMKSKETFLEAVAGGAIVNVECKRELEWLNDLSADGHYRIGIRLNINISRVSPEDAEGEDDNSRFGLSDETAEFAEALAYLKQLPHVTLAGLHIHRTAHSRSVRFYRRSIAYACEVIKKYGLQLDYLDVGGGYFGIFPNKPTYEEYSQAFYEVLQQYDLARLCVIVEPGNALVASCFDFVSEVIDVKEVEPGLWFVTTDGSRNDVDPFFRKSGYLDEEYYQQPTPVVPTQIVSGCTCLEYDRMFTLTERPLLQPGDRIRYRNVGAYTFCLTPMFIRYIPAVYTCTPEGFRQVRARWTAKEYVQKCEFKSVEG